MEYRDFDGVRVRIYYPSNRQAHGPAMLFIHGGGCIYFDTGTFSLLTMHSWNLAILFHSIRAVYYTKSRSRTNTRFSSTVYRYEYAYQRAEHYDSPCQWFALELRLVVVYVEYRHLPEHPYPAPREDCFRALLFLMRHASDFDIDPARIAIGGMSGEYRSVKEYRYFQLRSILFKEKCSYVQYSSIRVALQFCRINYSCS